MKKNQIYLLTILLTLASCNGGSSDQEFPAINKVEDHIKTIKIPKEISSGKEIFEMDLSRVVKDFDVVALETTPEALVGNIDELFFDDEKIFVIDRRVAKSIFIFKQNGEFISKIDRVGRGPTEYFEIYDATIDKNQKHIIIQDLEGRKFQYYDYNGDYLFKKKMPFLFDSFEVLDSATMAFHTSRSYNIDFPGLHHKADVAIGKVDGTVHFTHKSKDYRNDFTFVNSMKEISKFNDIVSYNPTYNDTIFRVTNNRLIAEYVIDFQGKGIPESRWPDMTDREFKKATRKYPYFTGVYATLDKYLYLKIISPVRAGDLIIPLIYNKTNEEIIFGNSTLIGSTETGHNYEFGFFDSPITSFKENTLVCVIRQDEAEARSEILKKLFKEKKVPFPEDFSIQSNPVLMFYHLK